MRGSRSDRLVERSHFGARALDPALPPLRHEGTQGEPLGSFIWWVRSVEFVRRTAASRPEVTTPTVSPFQPRPRTTFSTTSNGAPTRNASLRSRPGSKSLTAAADVSPPTPAPAERPSRSSRGAVLREGGEAADVDPSFG